MRLDRKIIEMARRFAEAGIETAQLDARLLATHSLGLSANDLILQFDRLLQPGEIERLDVVAERRLTREPVAHILGEREFWGLPFKVTSDTLVPRPDSETLVAGVLGAIADKSAPLKLVDIGTGTGCLLLSLLSELPNAFGVGVDISEAAISVARENADRLDLADRCDFICSNYADAFSGDMDILISNPPYLAQKEMADLEDDVALFDPQRALVSGESGLEAYEAIFSAIESWKHKPHLLAFEFGYLQADAIKALAKATGLSDSFHDQGSILKDLGGKNRVFLLQMQK